MSALSRPSEREKIEKTIAVFDEYEKRFALARASKKLRRPWIAEDREEILQIVRDVLKFDEALIPEIRVLQTQLQSVGGIEVRHMLFESWAHFYGICSLLVPPEGGKRPLIVLCPGHAAEGRMGESYQRMAFTLAKQGAYVLLLDNIGQGCRSAFGHAHVPEAFYCGKTVQGLIVTETCGWIRAIRNMSWVDAEKIGACGNSGGGTITAFLSALEPSLAAVASCGYASEFSYVLQKEKKHCDCNILSNIAQRLEMWEVYSLFAPKPLLLENGIHDEFFPVDLFSKNKRKMETVYQMLNAPQNLRVETAATVHSWYEPDMEKIGGFFADVFGLKTPELSGKDMLMSHADVSLTFPEDALSTGELVQHLTGKTMPAGFTLPDIIRPVYQGAPLDPDTLVKELPTGEVMRILAQFELALGNQLDSHTRKE